MESLRERTHGSGDPCHFKIVVNVHDPQAATIILVLAIVHLLMLGRFD